MNGNVKDSKALGVFGRAVHCLRRPCSSHSYAQKFEFEISFSSAEIRTWDRWLRSANATSVLRRLSQKALKVFQRPDQGSSLLAGSKLKQSQSSSTIFFGPLFSFFFFRVSFTLPASASASAAAAAGRSPAAAQRFLNKNGFMTKSKLLFCQLSSYGSGC